MTLEDLRNCKYVLTHNGTFHADDVFSTAFIKILNPNVKTIRTSDIPDNFNGLIYDIGDGEFDHHGAYNEKRANGIPYASFGKLWCTFAPLIYEDYVVKKIDKKFISSLDMSDNTGLPDTMCTAIAAMNPTNDTNGDNEFNEAVKFAKVILENLIKHEIKNYEEEKEVRKIYEESKNKEIIVLDTHLHFTDTLPNTKTLYVIFPSKRGGYSAQGVPINSDTVELKKPFPASWTEELPQYLTFCHSSRFLISANTLDDIIYACNIALKDGEL